MKVVWAQHANERLGSIFDFIDGDSNHRAVQFCGRLFEATERLRKYPHAGPVVPEDPAHRQLVVDGYRIVYRVAEKTVYVVTIVAPGMTYEQAV
jgi:plasmid stabilization system protein ParE